MIMERLKLDGEENQHTNPDGVKTQTLFENNTVDQKRG